MSVMLEINHGGDRLAGMVLVIMAVDHLRRLARVRLWNSADASSW
jgi:hypothetical protein